MLTAYKKKKQWSSGKKKKKIYWDIEQAYTYARKGYHPHKLILKNIYIYCSYCSLTFKQNILCLRFEMK